MEIDVDYQADMLAAKIQHYLITTMGRISTEANNEEFYRAFSYTMREEIMINWLTCARTLAKRKCRMLYYISMEYLPGRTLTNNIANLCANEIVAKVMQKLDRSLNEIIACEPDPGLGNGGLGRLASCFLDSLATLNYPAQAYGLRYQYGIFEQQLWDGMQIEAPDGWLTNEDPWQFRRDTRRVFVKYCGELIPTTNMYGDDIFKLKNFESVRALAYDIPIVGYARDRDFTVNTLRLWTTKESPRNFQLQRYNAGQLDQAAENTLLTDVLYPSDNHETGKRIRLKQEFLLVSASLQDIIRHYLVEHENFRDFADKIRIQINDTHPALIIAEMIRRLIQHYDIPWKKAVEITQQITGYTNHTLLREALEEWDYQLLFYLLPRQTRIIERLNQEFCDQVRKTYPGDQDRIERMSIIQNGRVRMANLAIVGSHRVNGVAELHTELLKSKVFKDFNEFYPGKIINITNGVTQRRWLLECNRDLAKFLTKRIGDGWITDFPQIKKIAEFAEDQSSIDEFLDIKSRNKQRLIDYLYETNAHRNAEGDPTEACAIIDPRSMFDMQIKRIHEYKRQLLNLLHIIMRWQVLKKNPGAIKVKRTHFIGGKAAAGYQAAKDIIRLGNAIARMINKDPATNSLLKLIYVENYNVSRAEMLIPAADLSEQISTAGMEASGTGNMKLAINGALTIGTEDGANIEMRQAIGDEFWPFRFGASAEEINTMRMNGTYHPREIYNSNEKIREAVDAIPSFAINDSEAQAFNHIVQTLLDGHYGGPPDPFFVLLDLQSYYDIQLRADSMFEKPKLWAFYAINNMAGMGQFSTDISIQNYCDKVWDLEPCMPDKEIRARVEAEYRKYDKCRIY